MNGLGTLLGDFDPDRFFDAYWSRRPLLCKQANADPLVRWGELSSAITRIAPFLSLQTCRLFLDGQLVPFHKYSTLERSGNDSFRRVELRAIESYCRLGATLTIRESGGLSPALFDLCCALRDQFATRVTANLYYTHLPVQGLRAHFDTHDIFVVQLEGSKRWHLGGMAELQPIVGEESAHLPAPSEYNSEYELEPGDVLYLPRGEWHFAQASEPSAHVAIGIHSATGVSLALAALRLLRADPVLRSNLAEWTKDRMAISPQRITSLLREISERICQVSPADLRTDLAQEVAVDQLQLPVE